ncbi:hypothetical protein QBC33DRAFT_48428 [Phialemonium atrogriseum]|uniref:Uncharacterized protein n=1 Tax=Phialemonium atrogriseum TaxID=1093897 RepID=A0AAJ0FH44_9PEZI|nr:uncharacterized protein QBC33DRAFT_48428 [Phialemonium atrogriseum]KAK1768236.1 hypothetical protein QBC33DRAFT_48428 [Phialemonium atrogriseum]
MLSSAILLASGLVSMAFGSALPLEKRANNGVYLANCVTRGTTSYSEMSYYNNARSGSQNGQLPDDIAWPSTTNGVPNVVTWEGHQRCGTYSDTGATFCSLIANGAQSLSTGQYAGSGSNSYGATFSCYKDNNRVLYNVPEGAQLQHTCYSIYYCFQN